MKPVAKLCTLLALLAFVALSPPVVSKLVGRASAQTPPMKPPDTIKLAAESKLGGVTFDHGAHVTQNRNAAGDAPIQCVECHHTAQPASALKPPHKTAYPADRTTTLTADLLAKDPAAAGVVACRDCHARAGETPKLLPAIPTLKPEGGSEVTLTNQQAFHRNCAGCHNEVARNKPDTKAPTATKCAGCHKKGA